MKTYYEEGDKCPEDGCTGVLIFEKVQNCYCHAVFMPPCGQCLNVRLYCPVCGWRDDD